MKYIKSYHLFNEALKPSQFRKYVKAFNKERYAEIFKQIGDDYEHDRNYYRVYIPLKKEKQQGYLSDTHKKIEKFLNDNGLEIVDYVEGTAKYKSEGLSRKNDEIENSQIRLVGNNFDEISQVMGKTIQSGVFSKEEALDISSKMGLDLIETSSKGGVSICKIIDYNKFLEEEGSEIRTVKIGQILQRLKNDELSKLFTSDEKRKAIVSTEDEELMVVISRHPYDIAGSDTDRDWTNCMTIGTNKSNRLTSLMDELEIAKRKGDEEEIYELERKINGYKRNGMNVKYLIHEVKEGSLISYLIKANDKNIESPLGVLNIKPYNNKKESALFSSGKIYGVERDDFKKTVDGILKKYFNKDITGIKFNLNKKVYSDFDSVYFDYDKATTDEILEYFGIKDYQINSDGSIDVNGGVNISNINLTKIPLKFGKVTGSFYCNGNLLKSLDGSPHQVGGEFDCKKNKLTSLEGCPKEVGAHFNCSYNQLTSLESAPKKVGGDFDCSENRLTSLKYSPKEVQEFNCSYNKILSLEFGPENVKFNYWCHHNQLITLKGSPKKVLSFGCNDNKLTSLEGCPKEVGGDFDCSHNLLTSLVGSPSKVSGDFDCDYNLLSNLEGGPEKVKNYFCNNNKLISLKGVPKFVTYGFYCRNNQMTDQEIEEFLSLKEYKHLKDKIYYKTL